MSRNFGRERINLTRWYMNEMRRTGDFDDDKRGPDIHIRYELAMKEINDAEAGHLKSQRQ